MRETDAAIFEEVGEAMLIGSTEIPGCFFNRPREIGHTDGTFVGLAISFDCQITPEVAALARGNEVSIVGRDDEGTERDLGTYFFQRRVPDEGDESGLVVCELGLTA